MCIMCAIPGIQASLPFQVSVLSPCQPLWSEWNLETVPLTHRVCSNIPICADLVLQTLYPITGKLMKGIIRNYIIITTTIAIHL